MLEKFQGIAPKKRLHEPSVVFFDGAIAYVELTRGHWATIDANDAPLVANRKWHSYTSRGVTYAAMNGEGGKRVQMHFLISGEKNIDHINRDGLDNRRSNLRPSTHTFQKLNQGIRKDNSSGINGVHLRPNGRWQARIGFFGKRVNLGHFDTKDEAAIAVGIARAIVDEMQSPSLAQLGRVA